MIKRAYLGIFETPPAASIQQVSVRGGGYLFSVFDEDGTSAASPGRGLGLDLGPMRAISTPVASDARSGRPRYSTQA
jgi:hypothetical protein